MGILFWQVYIEGDRIYVGEIDISYGHVQCTCTCIAIGLSLVYMQYVSLKPT